MEIGIVGLPGSGKSTLFEAMTGTPARGLHEEGCVRGQTAVPDGRFDRLVSIFRPLKVSPAQVPFIDVHGTGEKYLETLRRYGSGADALLHVVDGFSDPARAAVTRRHEKLVQEFLLSDQMIVEKRLEKLARLSKKALQPVDAFHMQLFPRLKNHLEEGKPLRTLSLSADEEITIRNFAFWTLKPELVVVNRAEGAMGADPDDGSIRSGSEQSGQTLGPPEEEDRVCADTGPILSVCGQVEAEIAALPAGERSSYLEALEIVEPAVHRVIRAAFSLLGRISYFTVGEDEVKAWVIPAGSSAPRAAAAIHQDFERGFIRAEVAAYADFIAAGETLAGVKAAGRLRLEGKEYIVKDGDIISFRFNV